MPRLIGMELKRIFIGIAVLAITFLSGYFIADRMARQPASLWTPTVADETERSAPTRPPLNSGKFETESLPEFTDLPNYEDIEFPAPEKKLIDVLETGAVYRQSEVIARTGETWLTLFENGRKYSLRNSRATVQRLRSTSYPGDEHDVRLKLDQPGTPIFAVKNLKTLKPGPVVTLYHRPSPKEIESRNLPIGAIESGFEQVFDLGKRTYTLRTGTGSMKDGRTVIVLVLEFENQSQAVAYNVHSPNDKGVIGNLMWVGDLDNDGKLDLYFDEYNEKGAFGVGLYLSSEADEGKLVKLAATFGMAGC